MSIPCKMRPAGLDSLPMGYTRLEFLESTGEQFIPTTLKPNKLSSLARWEVTSTQSGQILGWYQNSSNSYKIENERNANGNLTGIVGQVITPVYSYKKSINDKPIGFPAEVEINADSEYIRIGTNNYACPGIATGYSDEAPGSIYLFAQGGNQAGTVRVRARVMFIRFWRDGVDLANFIPALDHTGRPCMFDTVSKQPFHNASSGSDFIAGMTLGQALNLKDLPAKTATLAISLPVGYTSYTKVMESIRQAEEKGWTITRTTYTPSR